MPIILSLIFAFVWDVLLTFLAMFVSNVTEIPWLMDLSFWQVFGLLIVVSLATLKLDFSN